MLAANQTSRMSRIADHNIYLQTDHLYQPLRNALRKSTVSSSFLSPQNYVADNRLSASRIARNMRSLSPAETEIIKKNILIPVNKQLVPTRNLQKVMGKQFIAVDMQQKVGEAISPEEFSRVKTGTIEEIVYEVREDEPQNIYTYSPKNTITSSKVQHLSLRLPNQLPLNQQRFQNNIRQTVTNFSTPAFNSGLKTHTAPNIIPNLKTVSSEEFVREMPVGSSLRESGEKRGSGVREELKAYGFKQSAASRQGSMLRRDRQQYKYNLFSLIDEGGNNGCKNGCFGSNQILAPKITANPWK